MQVEDIENIIKQNAAVMLYFSGENCGVCEALRPKIKELLEENFPKIEQLFLSASQNQTVATHFNIFSVPTIIIFLDGKEFFRYGRNISLAQLKQDIERPYSMFFEE